MTPFTPVEASAGGAFIGLAAVLAMLLHGRIAGISGILGGLLGGRTPDRGWRVGFVLGLFAAPFAYGALTGSLPEVRFPAPLPLIVAGGLLVGVGTQLGSGCTSGHGVCGVARLSRRSLAATGVFMAAGLATVFTVRHLLGVW